MRTIEITIGMLLIIGLSLGIGLGVYHEYDGKNLRAMARQHAEMREEMEAAKADALGMRKKLAHYQEYIFGKLEEP